MPQAMTKTVSDNQLLGELGETAVKKIVLETGFIYEQRGRLEAGVDGLIELRDPKSGAALGKLLGVQVKATAERKYIRESDKSFEYTLKSKDLGYWRKYNIPVIIVLWRQSDGSAYWQDVSSACAGMNGALSSTRPTMFSIQAVRIDWQQLLSTGAHRASTSRR